MTIRDQVGPDLGGVVDLPLVQFRMKEQPMPRGVEGGEGVDFFVIKGQLSPDIKQKFKEEMGSPIEIGEAPDAPTPINPYAEAFKAAGVSELEHIWCVIPESERLKAGESLLSRVRELIETATSLEELNAVTMAIPSGIESVSFGEDYFRKHEALKEKTIV